MLNFIKPLRVLCVLVFATAFIVGCSSKKSRVGSALNLDTDLTVNFIVDADINPDENKRPSPVFVRLYELKSSATFAKADFIDLYEKDAAVIGGDFLNKQVLKPLSPGVNRTDNFVLKNGAAEIGLYVEFSQYRGAIYKLNFPIVEHSISKNEITVKISGTQISVAEKPTTPAKKRK